MKHPTTNPIAFLVHALLSLFVSALGAGLTAGIQLIGNGPLDIHKVIAGAVVAFGSWFSAGFVMLQKAPETQAAVSQSIDNLVTIVGSHSGFLGNLGKDIQEVKHLLSFLMPATPPTTIGQGQNLLVSTGIAAAAQPAPNPLAQAPAGWTNTNALVGASGNAPATVPQQDFPAPQFPPRFTANVPAAPGSGQGQ